MSGGTGPTGGTDGPRGRMRAARRFTERTLRAHFGVDARALAAFRIALGALLIANLALRARFLTVFYTDDGVFPRSVMGELYAAATRLSIHGQFGSAEVQALLFVVAGVAALALLLGYRPTLAAVVSLVLLFSLHGRNPLVLNGGDILLRHLTFWAILLPLSERWSVAALRRDRAPRDRIASFATAGLLLQVFVVYAINAVLKHQGALWREGTATQYIFGLDQFTVLLGDVVAEIELLVTFFGVAWFWMLTGSALLIVLRGWPRAIFAGMFVGAHVSMLLTMQLGLFPLISIAGLLVFFPAPVWDRVERSVVEPLSARFSRTRAALVGQEPRSGIVPTGVRKRGRRAWQSYLAPGIALLAIVVLVVTNVGAVTTADMGPVEATDLTDQNPRWNMFAPNPLQVGVWYVMDGTTASGAHVDAFHGGTVTYDPPPDMADTYPTARWRKYFSYVDSHSGASQIQASLADHLCESWDGEGTLESVTITKRTERINPDADNELGRRELGTFDCGGNATASVGG